MQHLFPSASALTATFGHAAPSALNSKATLERRTPRQARTDLYSAWSVSDDAQKKVAQLSDAAQKELSKASHAAQASAGKIELYSPKYYAAWYAVLPMAP